MLFPAPLSPTSATVSPGASSRSSPSRTTSGRAGYENETPSIRTGTAAGLGGAPAPPGPLSAGASSSEKIRSATAAPSALAWYSAPSRRTGRYSSGASTSTVSPAWRPIPPSTSRTPTVTATSATPSVAASSSTDPERKLARSVFIVASR